MKILLAGAQLFHGVRQRNDMQTQRSYYSLFELLLTSLNLLKPKTYFMYQQL